MLFAWFKTGELGRNQEEIGKNCVEYRTRFSDYRSLTRFTKMSMHAGGFRPKYQQYENGTFFRPRAAVSCAPLYQIFTMRMRQFFKHPPPILYNEISCYFRDGQNFHHSTPLAKCTSRYPLQHMMTFVTNYKFCDHL